MALSTGHLLHFIMTSPAERTCCLLSMIINFLLYEFRTWQALLTKETDKVILYMNPHPTVGYTMVGRIQSLDKLVIDDILSTLRTNSLKCLAITANTKESFLNAQHFKKESLHLSCGILPFPVAFCIYSNKSNGCDSVFRSPQ